MSSIAKARWYHDRIIDYILEAPTPPSQGELAQFMGYSDTWISIMVNSDAFKERLEERKGELTDPVIAASINERLDGLARKTLDRLIERVDSSLPIRTADLTAIAKLAIGDKNTRVAAPVNTNLYVVNIPPTAADSRNWLSNAQRVSNGPLLSVAEEVKPPAPAFLPFPRSKQAASA